MKNLNPFFTIGTVGMIVISILHITFAFILNLPLNNVFIILYPVFLGLIMAGSMQNNKNQKKLIPIRVKK